MCTHRNEGIHGDETIREKDSMFAERYLLESLGPQVLNEHESSCSAIGNLLCNGIDLFLVQSKFLIIGRLSTSICSNFGTLL